MINLIVENNTFDRASATFFFFLPSILIPILILIERNEVERVIGGWLNDFSRKSLTRESCTTIFKEIRYTVASRLSYWFPERY